MNLRSAAFLFLCLSTVTAPVYSEADRSEDIVVHCLFSDSSLPNSGNSLPLDWKFNSKISGIFGPGIVRVDDPKDLLGGRIITRVTAKNSMIYFAATQPPDYLADDSALFVGIMRNPDESKFPLGVVLMSSDNKFIKKDMGRCSLDKIGGNPQSALDAVIASNGIFDSMIRYYKAKPVQ